MTINLAVRQPATSQSVRYFETCQGAEIYQIPIQAFPGFWVYAYLVIVDGYRVLIDTGSGFGESNDNIEAGFIAVGKLRNQEIGLSELTHVLITHGHIDHFGGLSYIRTQSTAKVGVHELDLRNLTNTEERLSIVSLRLDHFLAESGVPPERRKELLQLYKLSKLDYLPVTVDFSYEASGMRLGPFEMFHTPGHCAGQVVIRLHDVLFSGDHVLADISPHQAPERLVLSTGLSHYLASLDALNLWGSGIHLTLGGHNSPITNLRGRLAEIQEVHKMRLEEVLYILKEPQTISEVSQRLFGVVHGYNVLLALEESGAHVEYLYQRGILGITNWKKFQSANGPVPVYYQTRGNTNLF